MHAFQFHIGTLRAKSRGEITLTSNNSLDINFNYFKEENDIVELRKGVRHTFEILEQKAFDK